MTLQKRPLSEALSATSSTPPGRVQWSWHQLAQVVWIVLAFVLLTYFVAGIPAFFQSSHTVCTLAEVANCPTGQLTPIYVQIFEQLHLSVSGAAVFLSALTFAVSVLYWAIGFLIFWRKSQEWMGLFTSMLLLMWGATYLGGFITTAQTPWLLQFLTNIIESLIGPVLVVFVFTFPTGRFTPRWTLVLFVLAFVVFVLSSLPITAPLVPGVVVGLSSLLPVVVQVYRYVRVYDAVQRQQIKWFVFGLSIGMSLYLIESVLSTLAPGSPWYQLFNGPMWLLIWTILLLSVSIPILRYRLWDIDVVINHTLVYGSLTVLLVALYVGLILALQALVRVMTGTAGQQPLVIVGSTLVIAALFQPLRHRLQALIDRRFYRRKYDAAKVVAAFSSSLRTELDLEQLREQLLAVVHETMQPSHVSLWVRQPTSTVIPSPHTSMASTEKAVLHEENTGHGA